jgi:hypothetical protein
VEDMYRVRCERRVLGPFTAERLVDLLVDVDAPGFLVEVSPLGLSRRERWLMVTVGLWGLGVLVSSVMMSVTYQIARDVGGSG